MLVSKLLSEDRKRLVTISEDAPLIDAARLFSAGAEIVLVCRSTGELAGVITKTDIVAQLGCCQGENCLTAAARVMTRDVVVCHAEDWLPDVWSIMKRRGLKNIPITESGSRPIGVLNARDALEELLRETADEESLLRDFVMGIGYR